jgi:hypothetical protein
MCQLKGWKQLYIRNGAKINCYYTVKTGIRKLFTKSILIAFLELCRKLIKPCIKKVLKILR